MGWRTPAQGMERCRNVRYRLTGALARHQTLRTCTDTCLRGIKNPVPSGSNTQLEKTFKLATGTEVAPLLERRNPSSPALGVLLWETAGKEILTVKRMEDLLLRGPFFYISLLETQLTG